MTSQLLNKKIANSEVIALNSAARRANGEYIGRIDNDTVVGEEFFKKFAKLHKNNLTNELYEGFISVCGAKKRSYRISRLSLPLSQIDWFIKTFSKFFKVESATDWEKSFGIAQLAL